MCILICIIFLFASHSPTSTLETPNMKPFMKEMTTGLLTTMNNSTKEYRPRSVLEIMNMSKNALRFGMDDMNHYRNYEIKKRSCFATFTTYRTAVIDMKRYTSIRYLYVENLEFEIGYLVQEIMHHYQMTLELYQMTERRYIPYPYQNYATTNFMLYMYVNLLEQSKVIIHLCNMLSVIEDKYKVKVTKKGQKQKKGVFDEDDQDKVAVDEKDGKAASIAYVKEEKAIQIWLQNKTKQKAKVAKEWKKKRIKDMEKGVFTIQNYTRTTAKSYHNWDIIYGWSIEDWWTMID